MEERPSNPFVFTKKTVFMQRIADAVSKGATRYIQGVVPIGKAGVLASKFDKSYFCGLTVQKAFQARKKGLATGKLYFWQEDTKQDALHWILLVTDGQFQEGIDGDEKWCDPKMDKQRVAVTNYNLVRVVTKFDSKPRWTWRYTRASYDSLGVNIIEIIRVKKDKKLKEIITQLWRSPGFSGIREQVKILQKLIITEWKRSRRENEVMPTIPAHLGYVRKLPDKGVKLRAIKIAKAKADKTTCLGHERLVGGIPLL
jgi:hypothetical protein